MESRKDQVNAAGDTPSSSRRRKLEGSFLHVVVTAEDEEGNLAC